MADHLQAIPKSVGELYLLAKLIAFCCQDNGEFSFASLRCFGQESEFKLTSQALPVEGHLYRQGDRKL
ncbi:hypothetical protein [Nostoc sp.]|uniref:hypothetical protein n=1 Tax=Nostoc sp. TaxID=1180 RepID=UPI002FFA9A13